MAGLVANALNKRVVNEFQHYPMWWSPIVTPEDFSNFQTVRWITLGGIGELPTVSEGAAYTELSLVHVSAVASNDSDATLKIGTSTDDEFLAETTIGDSRTPSEFDWGDFVDQHPRIEDGDIVVLTLDYDGATGTAAADLTLILTFTEG
jgi:hypothetical protein